MKRHGSYKPRIVVITCKIRLEKMYSYTVHSGVRLKHTIRRLYIKIKNILFYGYASNNHFLCFPVRLTVLFQHSKDHSTAFHTHNILFFFFALLI